MKREAASISTGYFNDLLGVRPGSSESDRKVSLAVRLNRLAAGLLRRLFIDDEVSRSIRHLRGLSDAQLRQLDIRREDIEQVVRHGKP